MDTIFPKAFEELVCRFKDMGCPELMSHCSRLQTTNMNESIHSKLWVLCNKHKNHGLERVKFAAQQVILTHNFGRRRASLLNVLGTMDPSMFHDLDILDRESVRVASRKHTLSLSTSTIQWKKVKKIESFYQKDREWARGRAEAVEVVHMKQV